MSGNGQATKWIPVALSSGLAPGEVMRVEAEGHDLALWRAHDNTVTCVHNRCPHRGMRLSFGFVRGNRLNCLYHGWQYGASGACEYIPAHPDLSPPSTLGVQTVQCDEQGGLVWISVSDNPTPLLELQSGQPLRSLVLNVPVDSLLSTLQSDTLPATSHPLYGCTATVSAASLLRTDIELTGSNAQPFTLVLSARAVSDNRCQLHAQLSSIESTAESTENRITASRWLEALRRTLEADA